MSTYPTLSLRTGQVVNDLAGDETTVAPSVAAVNEALAARVLTVNGTVPDEDGNVEVTGDGATDATTTSTGLVQLAGALGGTATAPTALGMANAAALTAALAAKQDALTAGSNITIESGVISATGGAATDATSDVNGVVRLAGALGGTAAAPTALGLADAAALSEAIDDRINALLVAGANVTLTYDDVANTLTIASSGGGGGGGLGDGDYGDVTVSGTGTVITIDNAAVTLAKMANMATGSVIGRTTASSGAPEVLSFSALKTAMSFVKGDVGLGNVDNTSDATKNAAAATLTNKTLAAPTLSGIVTTDGANITTANAMAALAVDVTKGLNTKTISADSTLTFSATPAANTWFGLHLTNSDTSPHVITIPSSFSMGRQAAITSFVITGSGEAWLMWRYTGSAYRLFGETPYLNKFDATAAPDVGDDTADGYGPGSLWLDATNNNTYICEDASAGAAVWHNLSASGGSVDLASITDMSANARTFNAAEDFAAMRTALGVPVVAQTFGIQANFADGGDDTTVLDQYATFAYTIDSTVTQCDSGTATYRLTINGTDVGTTANSVSSTEQTQTHSTARSVAIGDTVALVRSADSTCVRGRIKVNCTRTLA